MLQEIGAKSVEELFTCIPAAYRLQGQLNIDRGLTEQELLDLAGEQSSWNRPAGSGACFLGGGSYNHGWPALIDYIAARGEFMTSYTPYQPECSQGTLQAIFEFQSMIAALCGMEVANASMYDGASACAEAMLMAIGQTRRRKVAVSAGVHPEARETINTYLRHQDLEIVEAPLRDGVTDWTGSVDSDTAAVLVQQPNFLGCIENLDSVTAMCQETGSLAVASINPIAMGLLRSPGEAGFDIVVGDGQTLGVPMAFGGPHFGFFATRHKLVRKMPGRLVGKSIDTEGRPAYTLAFQTREQHIRREKATSNICTNNALMALRGCMHMAALGPKGLEEVACVSRQRMLELADGLEQIDGIELAFRERAFFNEAAFRAAGGAPAVARFKSSLATAGIHGVLPVNRWYTQFDGVFTLACTERISTDDIKRLCSIAADCFSMEMSR